MKTETVRPLPKERDAYHLSAALCPTAPQSACVYDQRGRRAALSLAGFIVQPGRRYEVRARPAANHAPLERPRLLHTAGIVDCLRGAPIRRDDCVCLVFCVRRARFWLRTLAFLWYHTILSTDVVVEWEHPDAPGIRTAAHVPLIVRKPLLHWQLLVWFVVWFTIGMIVEGSWKVGSENRGANVLQAVRRGDLSAFMAQLNITLVSLLALTWPLIRIGWYLWHVFTRAQELAARFREKYSPHTSAMSLMPPALG